MRILVAVALVCLASCASEKLAQAPPAGVDFTGHWKLNEADSDDPQRLLLAQINGPGAGQSGAPGGSGGGGGRGGRGGGRGGGGSGLGGPAGPAMPSVSAMGESLRWPGKQLEIKQVAGVVAFTSDGGSVICQPMEGGPHRRTHGDGGGRDGDASRRDAPSRSRDAPPRRCGWAEKILIVENRDSDEDHPPFEEHFGLSEDGRRLVEIVAFKGGRSSGFTMSRVWDRVD